MRSINIQVVLSSASHPLQFLLNWVALVGSVVVLVLFPPIGVRDL